MATAEVVDLLLREDLRGVEAARAHAAEIAVVAGWLSDTLADGGSVLFAGAGTSGRLGVLEAAECPPTFGTDPKSIRAMIAGGENAVFRAQEGAEDRSEEGARAAAELETGDLLIGLSASSVTPFTRGALERARAQGAKTVLLSCAPTEGLASAADLVLALDTGAEILTGSTRLKAGSATKAVLNAITTAAMVRLGKVYENLMVDLRPGSAKLSDRAVRIVQAAVGVSPQEARELLASAGDCVKTAIVMGRCQLPAEAARCRLEAAGGHVRKALEAPS